MENKKNRFKNATMVLSQEVQSVLLRAPDFLCDSAQEIVLRSNRPLCVECPDKRYYFTANGCITDTIFDNQMVTVSNRTLFETFQNICNYSIYTRQNEINNGFVTLRGGHRAGICGTAVLSDNKIVNIKDITTINIRIAREILGCADELYSCVDAKKGVLICGVPCSGKTTLIRDFARQLSYDFKVSVIDERNELSSTVGGVFQNDMGLCDVFDSYIKEDAITHAVRSMSPDVIVCDEISTLSDVLTIKHSVNSGVSFVATVHADCKETLLKRKNFRDILGTGAFSQIVFLNTRENAGKIKSIVNIDELDGELYA